MSDETTSNSSARTASNFIREIIDADLAAGKHDRVVTRFPPEPNGYLHIGHAKSICLNFGIARDYGGDCNLRFDDTNPLTEEVEYVESIQEDVRWLGFEWSELRFASDYFEQLYAHAEALIKSGEAYVDDQSAEQVRESRGTLTEPGVESPCRARAVEENLDLFRRMRAGEFEDGSHVLRAKIDMAHPNLVMRDPTLYRIRKAAHHRTGDAWVIYPMYDFTHCLSDSIEGVTHSLCTLEFVNNRALYDWTLDQLALYHPQQIEFARLNLSYTVLSKRRLIQLVREGFVEGWDDPRMPTLSGLRRRGCPPGALREFCERIGVAKADNLVDIAMLEFCMREELNRTAPRYMAVVNPIKATIRNFPEGETEWFDMPLDPEQPDGPTRRVPFSRTLWLERDDFREEAPRKFHRLAPGKEVRLRYAYYVTCVDVVKNDAGEVVELVLEYDPETRGGQSADQRKVKGTLHWVAAEHAVRGEARLYDRLFTVENPMDKRHGDFKSVINPESLTVADPCWLEPALAEQAPGTAVQFERLGYFCADAKDHAPGARAVFNRTVTLRDSWARIERQQQ